ncbi:MAG: hypothetical protein COV47_01180 [Candidatus Diapherotrites archaeon CG11_big_fil_rev_8_21_14_0_20_37_9]|nr:MAG: hypothetical protein COV47_01180 [Candidatus Diapherotrites archaeon CG11_big_fil_rev_8_21_14_0_20_37_9]
MNENEENIDEKVMKYRNLTEQALQKVELKQGIGEEKERMAKKLLEMARSYFSDGKYFLKQEKKLTALAAFSYAHAWIDAGVRLELLDGKNDDKLFVLP